MPAAKSKRAEVRSIYRRGDRVLVELPSGYYLLVIQDSKIIGGELWLEGRALDYSTSLPRQVHRAAAGNRRWLHTTGSRLNP